MNSLATFLKKIGILMPDFIEPSNIWVTDDSTDDKSLLFFGKQWEPMRTEQDKNALQRTNIFMPRLDGSKPRTSLDLKTHYTDGTMWKSFFNLLLNVSTLNEQFGVQRIIDFPGNATAGVLPDGTHTAPLAENVSQQLIEMYVNRSTAN